MSYHEIHRLSGTGGDRVSLSEIKFMGDDKGLEEFLC